MTVREKISNTLTERTWVPAGLLVGAIVTAIGSTVSVMGTLHDIRNSQRDERVEREKFQTQFLYSMASMQTELNLRTKSRWSFDMMSDWTHELERDNKGKITVPSARAIKQLRDQ